jgi:tRNA (guanine-N7-)-methyltransferase
MRRTTPGPALDSASLGSACLVAGSAPAQRWPGVVGSTPARTIGPAMQTDTLPPAEPTEASPPRRAIRSFVVRAGRMGPGQARALAELGPRFIVPFAAEPVDFAASFGRRVPLVLEIGFGMGDATAAIAQALPAVDFVGVEVHPPGVGALLKRIDALGLANLRIVQHDAVEVVERMVAPASLAGVHVFFPDPWHKARHHKRRLIQAPFVRLLASRLAAGGYLHCATDWEPYAQQMLEVLAAEPALVNRSEGFAPRPAYRPVTKFETRGLGLGHGVWDLVFEKR